MRADLGPVGEPHGAPRAGHVKPDHVAGGQHLGAELGRLEPGPPRQLGAGHPVRKTEVVLDPGALAGLATGRCSLHKNGAQSLGGAVYRRPQPGRAAPDHDEVIELPRRGGGQPDPSRQLGVGRLGQHLAVGRDHDGQAQPADVNRGLALHGRGHPVQLGAGHLGQPLAGRIVGGVPAVGHLVAGQELADLRGPRRPAVADDLGLGHRAVVRVPPRVQQRVHRRVQLLLGRVPGLEQVVVDVDHVDGVNGGVGVRVGGQQRPPRARVQVHRPLEELDPVHLRHPVVGQDHRDLVAAQPHLPQRLQRRVAGLGPDDPVLLPVLAAQIPRHRAGDARVIVDCHDRRTRRVGRRHRHGYSTSPLSRRQSRHMFTS